MMMPGDYVTAVFGPMVPTQGERDADSLRNAALGLEDALKRGKPNVMINRPMANLLARAMWDLADRVELDRE